MPKNLKPTIKRPTRTTLEVVNDHLQKKLPALLLQTKFEILTQFENVRDTVDQTLSIQPFNSALLFNFTNSYTQLFLLQTKNLSKMILISSLRHFCVALYTSYNKY